jgi:hypothetical protein
MRKYFQDLTSIFAIMKINISPMKKEIEATYLSVDKDSVRKKLGVAGFVLQTPEYTMRRKTFDLPNKSGQKNGAESVKNRIR